ncbi:MAG: D-cysteine desulfhydrase family protein [bacterium]
MSFQLPQSFDLARLPTPIEKLENTTQLFEGADIYIKRDDFTGLATTGNKIRKLEFLLYEAVERNCDCVITCGGVQSNHARATAVAAAKLGLKRYLILRNGMGTALEGNLFLDRLVGAEIEYISHEEYSEVDEIMHTKAKMLSDRGETAYIIPEGGSNEVGSWGYVKAAKEIDEQLKNMQIKIHHIVIPVGSGGTYAGLLIGKYLYDLPALIHGINVCENQTYFVKKIDMLLKAMKRRYDLQLPIRTSDIRIIDGYVGKGYGLSSQVELDLIKQVAQTEGIILDPVYASKAFLGMKDQIRKGKFKTGENVLFIHTGGIFGLFQKKELFF